MISLVELRDGCRIFKKKERRDAMYKVATFLVEHHWGKACEVAEGLGVLLLVWNAAFYRHGPFDFDALEKCIEKNQLLLNEFRKRDILSYSSKDDKRIRKLLEDFLKALEICEGKCKNRKSPVGVAKALHLLGPGFFPLWDEKIAKGYDCYYNEDPAGKYLEFFKLMQELAEDLAPVADVTGRTLLKQIDEYNYIKYTKKWID